MKNHLPDSLLSQLSEWVAATTALHFPRERWSDLERKATSAAKEFGFADAEAFVQWLVSSPLTREQIEILASHLTIAETYFWREPQVFEALVEQILPEIIRSPDKGDRRLRIWSAGCATGEEPYSIAIALRRALPAPGDWRITLLATDINPQILQRARAGIYGEWSFRNAPPWLKGGYFQRQDGKFEILPEIRNMVTFAYLNLAEDIYPSPLNNTNAMDLVFCRNVLMYFAPERARQVGQNLYHSLVEGGWLIVSASELSQTGFSQFASVHFPGAIVYRKDRQETRPPMVFRPEEMTTRAVIASEAKMATRAVIASEAKQSPPAHAEIAHLHCTERSAVQVSSREPSLLMTSTVCEESARLRAAPSGTLAPCGRSATRSACPTPPDVISESAPPQQSAYAQAVALYAQGRYAEVTTKLEGAETPGTSALAVRALANLGKLAPALAACEQAIAADKLDPGLHYLCATILQELNREGEAMAALRRALYLDPNFALAHFALGNLLLHQGNARAARKSFENVLALLSVRQPDDILPESEGLTAGRFREIIHATIQAGA